MTRTRALLIGGGTLAALLVVGGAALVVDRVTDDDLRGDDLARASQAALAETGEGRVASAERSDDLDHRYAVEVRTPDGREVDVLLDESFDVVATEDDDRAVASAGDVTDDDRVTDAEHAAASEAALAAAGSGRVTDVDRSDDADHAFEVEVRLDDGTELDVDLDAAYGVVRTTPDR